MKYYRIRVLLLWLRHLKVEREVVMFNTPQSISPRRRRGSTAGVVRPPNGSIGPPQLQRNGIDLNSNRRMNPAAPLPDVDLKGTTPMYKSESVRNLEDINYQLKELRRRRQELAGSCILGYAAPLMPVRLTIDTRYLQSRKEAEILSKSYER